MIIDTQLLQEKCKKILDALGTKRGIVADTLELEVANGSLYMNVTDKEYFVSVKLPIEDDSPFHAVVPASLFLNLITKTTTKTITMTTTERYLNIKGNGNYKLALIYDGTSLVDLPRINIENITNEFTIKNSILQSILKYNDKILYTSGCNFPVFYVDNAGAVTVSRCACLNTFELEQPVSLILSQKLVKLFKLFKSEVVKFTMGMDDRGDGVVQQKISFLDDSVMLSAYLNTDTKLVKDFPVSAIRRRAEKPAPYSATISKDLLLEALDRLSLFKNKQDVDAVLMHFNVDGVSISDSQEENVEVVDFVDACSLLPEEGYIGKFDVNDLLLILDSCDDKYLTISFGDRALSISKNNIKSMLPECK